MSAGTHVAFLAGLDEGGQPRDDLLPFLVLKGGEDGGVAQAVGGEIWEEIKQDGDEGGVLDVGEAAEGLRPEERIA